MDGFLKFFFAFMSYMLDGYVQILTGIVNGVGKIFNIPEYVSIFKGFVNEFTTVDWICTVIALILVIGIYLLVAFLIVLGIRKYIRFRRSIVGQEDILQELAALHRQVIKLEKEKEHILAMKVSEIGMPMDIEAKAVEVEEQSALEESTVQVIEQADMQEVKEDSRFSRLKEIDEKYTLYQPPAYDNEVGLSDLCERFRNFACSRMGLYYEIKIIRLFIAGLASTKLLLLQGISGTGKTSLPYCFGKFLGNDATIASVQPSWRDRTELFGYFNEFTKRFNETEVLKRIYESSFNDDVNVIILDEMNIARVEYYFAEMLSVLEMPNPEEWQLDLVPNVWPNDPRHLEDGKLKIPQNMWYVGTANNDDSTFAVSDKVYDRALPINLDSKGIRFDAPDTPPIALSYGHLDTLFREAIERYPVSKENMDKVSRLDIYVIEKLRIAFGNRILKQMRLFVPVYVACGGTELDGIDYILATKIFRKFESLNLAMLRDELKDLISFLNKSFGKDNMLESKAYLERLQKLF